MLKILLFSFLFSFSLSVFSQTGPGGVGNSTNNVLWLKADAGTSSTTHSTAISAWNDQSGNGVNVTQTISVQQPSFATNVFNGFPAIMFDNVTSTNDKMVAPDNAVLDNTSGYTFFTISRPVNYATTGTDKARVIVSKRNNVDDDESFMLFHYTADNFFVDIQKTDNRFNSSPVTFGLGSNCLIDVVYDGTLPLASRSKLYSGETLIKTASESNTLIPNNNSPLIIGSTDVGDPRPFGGYIGEVIIYREALNKASRIIVNNYLSSKYNIALAGNDKYAGDNVANGDYDRQVAGIGMDTIMPGAIAGSNTSFAPSVSGGLGITGVSGFNAGDYILAGHAVATNTAITTDIAGMTGPSSSKARWLRIWYIDVTTSSSTLQTNITFDNSDGAVTGLPLGIASDYVLLYRAGQTGNWTELAVGSAIVGDNVQFNNITLNTDGYYTIGTKNFMVSPLPIELISFDAIKNGSKVDLSWVTATETNNDYYTIERSRDGVNFEPLTLVDAAGNSTSTIYYADVDYNPYNGISYYRLKQTDFNGMFTYSKIVAVNYAFSDSGELIMFPNPTEGSVNLSLNGMENQEILVVIRDITGKECYSKVFISEENNMIIALDTEGKLAKGTYIVVASSNNKLYSQKLIVK